MDFSDWVYLGFGMGLGMGISWLWRCRNVSAGTPTRQREVKPQPLANDQPPYPEIEMLAQQLKQTQLAYQMASQMSQFKAGFLARTAHELRSPLSSLIGAHQLILAGLCDDPAEERAFIAQANESAFKLMQLLDNIIAVAKTDRGTEKMLIQPLPLIRVLQEVEELIHLPAKNNNIRLQLLLPEPDLYIFADRPRLKQVLVNLIDTAIAQMKAGNIDISAHSLPATGFASIWIDLPRSAIVWSEPVDLLQSMPMVDRSLLDSPKLSPGMNLLVNQTLLELMQGRLEVVANPPGNDSDIIRLQCSLPLAIL